MFMRLRFLCVAGFALCFVSPPVQSEMYKYVDAKGRLHFTQDIGQVPVEYRDQVEKKVLQREISVTGEGGGRSEAERVNAIKQRSRKLRHTTPQVRPRANPVDAPKNRLAGAPEPNKYDRHCWWRGNERRCKKTLTNAWRAWDAANGGNNGAAVTRRKVGSR